MHGLSMNYGITVSKMIWVVKTHFYMLIFEYDIHRMAIIHFTLDEGEPTITFLGDLDRICHIIDKHAVLIYTSIIILIGWCSVKR